MTSNEILKADMLDILFDDRNKQYGAYTLRKTYNSRLGIALGISLSTVMFLFFLIPKNKSSTIIDGDRGQVELRTIQIPNEAKKIISPPVKRVIQPVFRQKQFTSLVIVNKKTVDPPPDIRDLTTSIISNKTVDGQVPDNIVPMINESVPAVTEKQEKPVVKDMMPVQREPEFPGGQQAWLNFLQKYLIAPEELEAGEKKNVAIRFQVSAEGIVTNFEIVQSAGTAYDNEVIRVLKKMPKWKPAIQNGQPVARAFTQPVTFMGVEQ